MAHDDGGDGAPLVQDLCSVLHSIPGRMRLGLRAEVAPEQLSSVSAALTGAPGVRDVRTTGANRSLVVEYDPEAANEQALLTRPVDGAQADGVRPLSESVRASLTIDAPIDAVWQVLSDVDQLPTVLGDNVRLRELHSPEHWTVDVMLPGGARREDVRVTERVQPVKVVMDMSGRFRARITLELEEAGNETVAHERLDYEPFGNALVRLASGLAVRPKLAAELASQLRRLARLAEARERKR